MVVGRSECEKLTCYAKMNIHHYLVVIADQKIAAAASDKRIRPEASHHRVALAVGGGRLDRVVPSITNCYVNRGLKQYRVFALKSNQQIVFCRPLDCIVYDLAIMNIGAKSISGRRMGVRRPRQRLWQL